MPRKNWLRSALVRLTAGDLAQAWLERAAVFAQGLMGIGTGSSPEWSGEKMLAELLRRLNASRVGPLCIFDVGANKGQFLAQVIEPLRDSDVELTVHAFEPGRSAFTILRQRFADRPGFRLNNFALGNRDGDAELHANAEGSGLASLSKRRLDHIGIDFGYSERIAIRKLDGYCAEQGIARIDLLKLDVEGHELDVLQGGVRMLDERRVRMVSFEFGGCNIDSRTYFQDFWYFFREHGPAQLHRITPSGRLVAIPEYREQYEQFRTTNYLVRLSPDEKQIA